MPIIHILLVLVIAGVCLYLIQTYIPMAPPIKTVLTVIVVLLLVFWLLNVFGISDLSVGGPPFRPR